MRGRHCGTRGTGHPAGASRSAGAQSPAACFERRLAGGLLGAPGRRRAAFSRRMLPRFWSSTFCADAFDLEQVFGAAERPVFLPVLDDRLRLRRADAVEFLGERRCVRRVEVDGPGERAGQRQQADDQALHERSIEIAVHCCGSLAACMTRSGMARGGSQVSGRAARWLAHNLARRPDFAAMQRASTVVETCSQARRSGTRRTRQELEGSDAAQACPRNGSPGSARGTSSCRDRIRCTCSGRGAARRCAARRRCRATARASCRRPRGRNAAAMSRRSLSIVSISRTHSSISGSS